MQCDICRKNQATIHLTEIIGGARSETHLCEHCAQEQGIAVKNQIPINELLSGLLSSQPTDEDIYGLIEDTISCPYCGITLEQFRREAVLGCPHDYEVFEKVLAPLIKKTHNGKITHCGKIPSKIPPDTRKQAELLSLRQQLDAAVTREDYELAAQLRDKIAEIQ